MTLGATIMGVVVHWMLSAAQLIDRMPLALAPQPVITVPSRCFSFRVVPALFPLFLFQFVFTKRYLLAGSSRAH